jgi:putative transposase
MPNKRYTVDEKIAIVVASLSGAGSLRDLCKRHNVSASLLYLWRKRFLEGGRIALEMNGKPVSRQVKHLRTENDELKRMLAEEQLVTRLLKGGLGSRRLT